VEGGGERANRIPVEISARKKRGRLAAQAIACQWLRGRLKTGALTANGASVEEFRDLGKKIKKVVSPYTRKSLVEGGGLFWDDALKLSRFSSSPARRVERGESEDQKPIGRG